MKTLKILISMLILINPIIMVSQESDNKINSKYELILNTINASFIIKGTSNLHDWVSTAEKASAYIIINNFNDVKIEKLNLIIDVNSIKNDKGSSMMDRLTRKALKESKFPKITYVFISAETLANETDELKVKLIGNLTIAGKTNNVSIIATISKLKTNVVLKGSHKLKMTDFDVDPPTALFGTVKTGDEITIDFSIKF